MNWYVWCVFFFVIDLCMGVLVGFVVVYSFFVVCVGVGIGVGCYV